MILWLVFFGLRLWAADDVCLSLVTPTACELLFTDGQIFSCTERQRLVADAGYSLEILQQRLAPFQDEHVLVAEALALVAQSSTINGRTKAALWEQLSLLILKKIGTSISHGHSGRLGEDRAFIFQGQRKFMGRSYFLVILESGKVFTGRGWPIYKANERDLRLDRIKEVASGF